jgi:hypothetical protein
MWTCINGELGAEALDLKLPISISQSDIEPFLFFFLANALLKELLN